MYTSHATIPNRSKPNEHQNKRKPKNISKQISKPKKQKWTVINNQQSYPEIQPICSSKTLPSPSCTAQTLHIQHLQLTKINLKSKKQKQNANSPPTLHFTEEHSKEDQSENNNNRWEIRVSPANLERERAENKASLKQTHHNPAEPELSWASQQQQVTKIKPQR